MAEGTSGGQSNEWIGRVFLFSMSALTIGVNMIVVYLLLVGPDRLWTCLPAFIAAVLLAAAGLSGGLILSPQKPLEDPVSDLPEGPVARAESWGGGLGVVLAGASMAVAGIALGLLGASVWIVGAVSSAALAGAALVRRDAARLHRPSELRLTVHALELWEPRRPFGDLKRRHRIGLHEVDRMEVIEDDLRSKRAPSGGKWRRLLVWQEHGWRLELPLPMRVHHGDRFVARVRELVAEARAVQPDDEAVDKLRRMSHRARTTE